MWVCRLFGHDVMRTSNLYRVCTRCGRREMLRNLGHVEAWVELPATAVRTPNAP
jgi:hypothetical protein